jgi:Mrp family chromosome partitioning ATPase
MVIEKDATSYRMCQKVKAQLEKSGCKILGAVLNKVESKGKGYYGKYGQYGGAYYGNPDER